MWDQVRLVIDFLVTASFELSLLQWNTFYKNIKVNMVQIFFFLTTEFILNKDSIKMVKTKEKK